MRKKAPFLVATLLLAAVPRAAHGADDKPVAKEVHEAVIEDLLKNLNGIADVFEGIKDAAGAKKANPKLDKLADELEAIADRAKKLEKPEPGKDKTLKEKYGKQLESTMKRFVTSAHEVSKIPEVRPILKSFGKRLQKIGQAMKNIGQ